MPGKITTIVIIIINTIIVMELWQNIITQIIPAD